MIDVQESLRKGETIVIFCNCSVSYSGRAESYLPPGDRLVIVKADGTLLVHQPKGNMPVNYMKEGATHHFMQTDGGWRLESINIAHKEHLDIDMSIIYSVTNQLLADAGSIELAGTERDMSDMIFDQPDLIEPGFAPLSREEHTKVGFIDVFGHDRQGSLVVVECKRYQADFHAVHQLERYVEKIKKLRGVDKVRGIIAAPHITDNAKALLEQKGFSFKMVEPPKRLERHKKQQKRLGEF